jgi:predicted nucleic acid-binding Zn ribbon protein
MPTYRYKCEQCGTFTEREYRMSTCPAVIQSPCCDSLCNANRVVHNVDLSAAESRIKPGRSERDKRYS